ncbi:V-set and transmembrane domain-containing protein 4a [Lepisosteus oculatus]|uniref:V-set and transmembrane domain-containing protein 4a n=1 Tax=Lepisosteus oculatus TaxID=7918 RepID=UPI0037201096
MKISSVVIVLLTRALIGEVCGALNVTVSPGPITVSMEGENVTLSCHVSQRKKSNSHLVIRWVFSLVSGEEHLIVKMNMRRVQVYGNDTRRFNQQKQMLVEEMAGTIYNLVLLNISQEDKGHYMCKVQEIRRHRNRWRASSNGTAATELRVRVSPVVRGNEGIWRLFEDVYLCAVLICSVGIMCVFVFTVILICQCLHRKSRLKASYYLVKSPQNSSGETVTSVVSSSPVLPKKEKKFKKKKSKENADVPPEIPAKAPIANMPRRPKLLKAQPRKAVLPRIAEESLTYAELELVKPQPETRAACTGTVYAQILFEEKQL